MLDLSKALRRFMPSSRENDTPQRATPRPYCDKIPHPQNALDVFAGEWASKLPPPCDSLRAGDALLFEDARLEWAIQRLGGVSGKRVLELGPLEGGHTCMLDRAGAVDIFAIEGNTRAYLRCLITKELLNIRAARFACGNFVQYLRETHERFDVVIASGVLYHMVAPVELIARVAAITDAAYFWTHYYDEAAFKARGLPAARIVDPQPTEHDGYRHATYRHEYRSALKLQGFCGGTDSYAYWLSRADILGALRHFGLANIEIAYEEPNHPLGPAFALLARRCPVAVTGW